MKREFHPVDDVLQLIEQYLDTAGADQHGALVGSTISRRWHRLLPASWLRSP
ncbi:hypothetical protein D3C78_383760 [compost metagenome]